MPLTLEAANQVLRDIYIAYLTGTKEQRREISARVRIDSERHFGMPNVMPRFTFYPWIDRVLAFIGRVQ